MYCISFSDEAKTKQQKMIEILLNCSFITYRFVCYGTVSQRTVLNAKQLFFLNLCPSEATVAVIQLC